MKNLIAFISAIALVVAGARAQEMRTIEGQVFIRTQGAETFKLSLVEVQLFDSQAIAADVDRKRKAAEPIYEALQPFLKEAIKLEKDAKEAMIRDYSNAHKAWEEALYASSKAQGMVEYLHLPHYYLSGLPNPLQTTKTDADGKFSFKVPRGSYVLAAVSSREVGKVTEFYGWMIRAVVDADKKVMLANDNLATSNSPESVIVATEFIHSGDIPKSLASVEAFLEKGRAKRTLADAAKREELRVQELPKYRRNPGAAQQAAIGLYPELGVAGSPFNKEFVARVKRYRAEKKDFFAEPDWPIRLAKECNEDLSAKEPAK